MLPWRGKGKPRRGLTKDQIHKVRRRRRTFLRSSDLVVMSMVTMLVIA